MKYGYKEHKDTNTISVCRFKDNKLPAGFTRLTKQAYAPLSKHLIAENAKSYPYTLTPYSLLPTPYFLLPTPCSLLPACIST